MKASTHFFKNLDVSSILEPADATATFTGTKVVATIGPSCRDVDTLVSMICAGMSGARVDLTWGPLDFHRKSLDNLQAAVTKARRLCCTMVDTLGRVMMVRRPVQLDESGWPVHDQAITITTGQRITVTTRTDLEASDDVLPVTYPKLPSMTQPGDTLYISKYLVTGSETASAYLRVVDVSGQDILCEATNDAVLEGLLTVFHIERSQDNLVNIQNDLPLFSVYDQQCLVVLAKFYEIDFLCLSHCRSGNDVEEARRLLDQLGMRHTRILAKIGTRQALLNFPGILSKADGIIICRGSLGLDTAPEKAPMVQKALIQACNTTGKPVLITRVVDTMVCAPRPTRAEATDVANAVLDGCDGILLGVETLCGKSPELTVRTVAGICREAEKVFDHRHHREHLMETALAESWALGSHRTNASSFDLSSMDPQTLLIFKQRQAFTRKASTGSFTGQLLAAARFGPGSCGASCGTSSVDLTSMTEEGGDEAHHQGAYPTAYAGITPYISKLESIASAAVRAADTVGASLLVVWTHTGTTAQLVAKYRPTAPILTLVVPQLVSDALSWRLEGKAIARHCCLARGVLPMLAAPGDSSDALLQEALQRAAQMGLLKAHDQVVCVQRIHEDFAVKIVSLNELGVVPKAAQAPRISDQGWSQDCGAMGVGTPQKQRPPVAMVLAKAS